MSWMENVIASLSPDNAVALERLVELQAVIDKHTLPDGTDHILSLLRRFNREGLPSKDELAKLLQKIGIKPGEQSAINRLVKFYGHLEEKLGRDQLELMTQPLSSVYQQDPLPLNVPLSKSVDIPLPKGAEALSLKLGLDISAAITVDPRPDTMSALVPNLAARYPVLVHMNGQLGLNAGVNLPVKPVLFRASASGRVEASLAYRFLNRAELSWGRVLVDNAARLRVTPFDIDHVARQLEDDQLASIEFSVEGTVALGGSVAVATPMGLIKHVDDVVSAGISFSKDYQGEFRFHIDSDPERAGYVRLRLERLRVDTMRREVFGGLSMDLTELFKSVQPTILAHLGSAKQIVDKLVVFAEPGTFVRDKAKVWLDGNTNESWYNDLALSLVAFDPTMTPSDVIGELLQRRFETTSVKWATSVDVMKDDLVGDLQNRLNLTDAVIGKLDGLVSDVVSDFFAKADKEIKAFMKKDDNYQKVVGAWDDIGRRIDSKITDLDARTAAIRELLQRVQERIGTTMLLVEQATEVRLAAKLAATSTEVDGEEAELTLAFKPQGQRKRKVRDAWLRALTGDFAGVVAEDASSSAGADIQVVGGRLARFRRDTRGKKFEAVLLDFRLGGASILESTVRIESDPWGNVQVVTSSAKVSAERSWLETKRKLELVEAHRLVLASRVGGIGINTVFNHKEERLDTAEIADVLKLFRDRALISALAVQETKYYWRQAPAESKQGELVLRLDLGGHDVSTLLHLNASTADFVDRIRRTGSRELGWAFGAHFLGKHNPSKLLAFLRSKGFSDNWADILYESDKPRLQATLAGINDYEDMPAGFSTTFGLQSAITRAQYCVEMLTDMSTALTTMREIHALGNPLSDMTEAEWEQTLKEKQDKISEHMKSWITVSAGHVIFGKVRPQTVALFRTLALLAGKTPENDKDLLTVSINSPSRGMKVIKRAA